MVIRIEDFIVGGSSLYDATLFIQKQDGVFYIIPLLSKTVEKKSEDEGLLLFDADNDNDLDLYVVSGSYEGEAGDRSLSGQIYTRTMAKENLNLINNALPSTVASGSCVRAADYDADGDLDLFVGGRVVAGSYPLPS